MQIQLKAHRNGLGLLMAAIVIAAIPSSALAEPYVPPGNSAATQYTEAVPTVGGPKATGKSKHGKSQSPSKVLGTHNTERLDAQGSQGRAAAEVAAATAPSTIPPAAPEITTESAKSGTSNPGKHHGSKGSTADTGAAAPDANAGGAAATATNPAPAQSDGGSSGLGEVVDQATGSSSSGQLGLLLPLLIVSVAGWSIVYLLRQRKRTG